MTRRILVTYVLLTSIVRSFWLAVAAAIVAIIVALLVAPLLTAVAAEGGGFVHPGTPGEAP